MTFVNRQRGTTTRCRFCLLKPIIDQVVARAYMAADMDEPLDSFGEAQILLRMKARLEQFGL